MAVHGLVSLSGSNLGEKFKQGGPFFALASIFKETLKQVKKQMVATPQVQYRLVEEKVSVLLSIHQA